MKRILFFNYEYPPLGGGAANATKYILKEYAKRDDVMVDLITSSISGQYIREKVGKNIIIHRLPIGKNPDNLNYQSKSELIKYSFKAYNFSKKLIKENKYDLTHSFFAVPCGVISHRLKKKYGIPYIVSLRGSDVPGYSERFQKLYTILTPIIHMAWHQAKFVVTNSKGLTELAQKSDLQQKFLEIFNGIDTNFYQPSHRSSEDRQKEFRILLASRLTKRKGFNYAIDAFAELAKEYSQITMQIAGGEGNAMIELKEQVNKLGLADKIKFSGLYSKEDSPKIYNWADIFVMPSLNEGMSNNLLEALASGLPVLMTPTGGAEELVLDGQNGYLIKMKDTESIVEKLRILIDSSQKCDKFGQKSRELAEEMSWKGAADEYIKLYKTIN